MRILARLTDSHFFVVVLLFFSSTSFVHSAHAQDKLNDLLGWESLKDVGLTDVEEQTSTNSYAEYRPENNSQSFQSESLNQLNTSNSIASQPAYNSAKTTRQSSQRDKSSIRRYSYIAKQDDAKVQPDQSNEYRQPSPLLPKQDSQVPLLASANPQAVYQIAQVSSNPQPITQLRERRVPSPESGQTVPSNYPTIDAPRNSGASTSSVPTPVVTQPRQQVQQANISVARYSLSDIIRETVNYHPSVARSYASYERARSQARAAGGQWQPQLSLFATHNFKGDFNLPANQSNPANESKNTYGLRLTQNLNYQNLQLTRAGARQAVEANKERLFESQDQIGLEAGLSYVQIFRFYNRFEIGVDYLNLLSRIKGKVAARSESGLTNALESKKVAVIEARIIAENEFNRRQYETAQIFLSNVSGIDNLNIRSLQDFNFRIPSFALTEDKLLSKAISTNRSLAAAKKDIEVAEIEWKKEKLSRYPAFDLDADITYQDYIDETRNGTFRDGSVRLNMNYDLWTGRTKANEIASSRWELEEDINQYETTKLHIVNQIQESYAGFNVALSEYKHAEEARKKAIELLRLQEQDFSRGAATSLLDLINTTQEWYRSASEEIDAYYELMSRYLQIKRQTGEILDNNI